MRIMLDIDGELLVTAKRLTGLINNETLVRDALKALVERESARRLAKLGGSEAQLKSVSRREPATDDSV